MKRVLTVFLVLFNFFNSSFFSQSKKEIDSINQIDYIYISNHLLECKKTFVDLLEKSKKIQYLKGQADAYYNLALCDALLGDYKSSIQFDLLSLKLYEKLKNHKKIARIYADIGYRIRYIDYKQGCFYFHKAIEHGKKYKVPSIEMAPIYNNYGETIKEEKLDSAIYYFETALKLAQKESDSIGIPFSLNKLAESYAKKRMFETAFNYLKKSDVYRFKNADSSGIADNYAYRADIFYEIPVIDSAIKYYLLSYELSKRWKYNALERFCSKRLANLFRKKKNYEKALFYFEINKTLEDSVLNGNVKNEMAHLEIRYDTEKTKRELAEQESKLATKQKYLVLTLTLLILIIIISYFAIRFQRLKRKRKINEILWSQELENAKKEKHFMDEKMRIARELHDNIGSHLTFIISSLDNLNYTQNEENKTKKLNDLTSFGRQTMKDLRDTIWAMNHEDGNMEVLLTRLAELRSILPPHLQIQVHSNVHKELPLKGIQLLNIYRIIQEFIQNTIKYAMADLIHIEFLKTSNGFVISIIDNGRGFDLKEIRFGNGLLNMKRRCEEMNGKFIINSSEKGTEIECNIPV
ncbi:MAG: hypothetical protein HYU67_00585 [Flavobacteriia bacterium]|nr:hypothetical protein [Flavobacteriia bacterium]